VVQRNLERLSRTINALLDYSRMEMGRIGVTLQPFELGPLVESILAGLRAELDRKSLKARGEVAADLPPVIGDRDKISQVLENLIVNALKFTPDGGGITISAVRDPHAPRPAAQIVVADTGIGIPSDQLGKIFNRFHQVDGSTTRRFGGVGLGLSIVKSILEAHGAPIRVESEEGRGTRFRFSLPLLDRAEKEPRDGSERMRQETAGRAL
jgi:signal transduction histidine kinase